MRPLLVAAITLGALGLTAGAASADDGCNYDYRGRLKYCEPGAQPGVQYYRRDSHHDYQAYEDDRHYEKPRKKKCRGGIGIGGGKARVCIRL